MIGSSCREITERYVGLVARYFKAFPPNVITATSILLGAVSAYYFANQMWILGGTFGVLAALADAIDGWVARNTSKVTKWGSYFDALADRYVEGFILFGIGYGTGYWVIVFPILFASLIIPYAKARVAIERKIENTAFPDLFERAERLILLIIGVPIANYLCFIIPDFLFYYLVALAIAFNIGAIQRIIRARRFLM